jgi:hypothetical protein
LIHIGGAAQVPPSTKEEESKMTGYDFDADEREIGRSVCWRPNRTPITYSEKCMSLS